MRLWFGVGCGGAESVCCFFFNDTATTDIYTLSLHGALPIYLRWGIGSWDLEWGIGSWDLGRSEENTSELRSRETRA